MSDYFDIGGGSNSGGGSQSGIMQLISGLLSHSGRPFAEGERTHDRYTQPWSNAGRNAINPFTNRLGEMGNGKDFANGIMSDYQESPFARNQQQQGVRTGNAFASANGLSGSTPMASFMQQNAQNISSKDMQQYFDNRMGINRDYMNGQGKLMDYGYGSDQASAPWMGEAAAGKAAAENSDKANVYGGAADIFQQILKAMMSGG